MVSVSPCTGVLATTCCTEKLGYPLVAGNYLKSLLFKALVELKVGRG